MDKIVRNYDVFHTCAKICTATLLGGIVTTVRKSYTDKNTLRENVGKEYPRAF